MRRFFAALLVALGALCVGAGTVSAAGVAADKRAAPAAADRLMPHKAVYALSLGELRASTSVVQAAGRFEFEWQDVCDGWTVDQRFRLALLYEDGLSVTYGWSLSSWESKDGRRYRFFIRRFDGSGLAERVRGEAELGSDGSGRAMFHEPDKREVALPAGTLFPTHHTLHVLERAEAGSAPVWSLLFDGSDEAGHYGVSAALSRRLPATAPVQLPSPLLKGVPSWRVDLAYYEPQVDALEPEQEQALRLFANGVVDELRLDYGEFVLDADLDELSALPRPGC